MKSTRILKSILPFALAGLLLTSGCKKQGQQPNSTGAPNSSQSAVPPPPPPDQTGAAQSSSSAPNTAPSAAPENQAAAPAPQGTAEAPATQGATEAPAPPPPPPPLVVPAGTHLAITLQQAVGSKISHTGDSFAATVAEPIVVNGVTVIRAGAPATGTVIDAKALGRFKGEAILALRLDSVRAEGRTYEISSSTLERAEKGKGKRSAGFIGGGAGAGALIGGLAGGGKGALIGGLLGAGAGTAGAGLTGKKNIVIPAESTLTFRLERPITVNQR